MSHSKMGQKACRYRDGVMNHTNGNNGAQFHLQGIYCVAHDCADEK